MSVLVTPAAATVSAGRLQATFDPDRGMLGTSLKLRGTELLGPLGMPFLHPWANRLSDPLAGIDVPRDDNGLPIHGTHAAGWEVEAHTGTSLLASLHYDAAPAFPYAHCVTHLVRVSPRTLRVDTSVRATGPDPVPVAFGFHPYFRVRRDELVTLPRRRHLLADERLIPTGSWVREPAERALLGDRTFDDGYVVGDHARFAIGRRLSMSFVSGYTHAQVYAPARSDFICFEPMTAPTNALISGRGLRTVARGDRFRAAFEVRVA